MFGVIGTAFLFVFGLWWCKDVIGRFPKDLNEFRTAKRSADKGIIVFFWVLTAGILILVGWFAWGLIGNILRAFQ